VPEEATAAGEVPEEPLIYEAALRVLMAKQSAWQAQAPPKPSLKTRLLRRFRPQLEVADRSLLRLQEQSQSLRVRAKPYMSVILAVPVGFILIWTGYVIAKSVLLMIPR
jgi:hypothetical protein